MGSVSSVNPGVANLLQTLTNLNSPVMSSPAAVAALKKAPAADIVQLSDSAAQLQGVDELFGVSNGANTSASSLLATLGDDPTNSAATPSAAATSQADQLADYQAASQAAENQGLLGAGSSGSLSGSLIDATG